MTLFTVDADGSPLGMAATPTAYAAIALVAALCRTQDRALAGKNVPRRNFALSVRRASPSEEQSFLKSSVAGGVRLAGILIETASVA